MAGRRSFPVKIDKWDSHFFKTTIARLTISGREKYPCFSDMLTNLIRHVKEAGARHLIIKLEYPDTRYQKSILASGMKRCGESVDLKFSYKAGRGRNSAADHCVKMFEKRDINRVEAIAKDAFRRSYFYKCGIGKKIDIDHYHETWVRNLSQDRGVRMFVAKKNAAVVGFLVLKINSMERYGRIILIAVHKRYRGKGLGSALIRKCIEWGDKKVDSLFVKTQKDNKEALLLYRKAGFEPLGSDKIFCKKY